jgi:hypothetical protein
LVKNALAAQDLTDHRVAPSQRDRASMAAQDSKHNPKQKLDIVVETSIIMVNEQSEAKNSVSITNRTIYSPVR